MTHCRSCKCLLSHLSYHIKILKGSSGARLDDTKSLKSAILDWITLKMMHSYPLSLKTSNMIEGFTMNALAFFFVPLANIGITLSEAVLMLCLVCMMTVAIAGPKRNSEVMSWRCQGINGQCFCTKTIVLTLITHGMVCFTASC